MKKKLGIQVSSFKTHSKSCSQPVCLRGSIKRMFDIKTGFLYYWVIGVSSVVVWNFLVTIRWQLILM